MLNLQMHGRTVHAVQMRQCCSRQSCSKIPEQCNGNRSVRRLSLPHSRKPSGLLSRVRGTKIVSSAVKQGYGEVDPAYTEGGDFLKSIGMTNQAEVARVLDIAMNPNSLFFSFRDKKRARNHNARRLSVADDMRPVVDFLETIGLEQSEIVKVITDHPPVLCYSVAERLEPFVSYLHEIGVPNPGQTIKNRPSLLGLNVDENLRKIVGYLKRTGEYTDEKIIDMLENTI